MGDQPVMEIPLLFWYNKSPRLAIPYGRINNVDIRPYAIAKRVQHELDSEYKKTGVVQSYTFYCIDGPPEIYKNAPSTLVTLTSHTNSQCVM